MTTKWIEIARNPKPELFGPTTPNHCSLLNNTKDKTVLDYGSGIGRNASYLTDNFKEVTFYDIPEMSNNFPCVSWETAKSKKYDLVFGCFTFQFMSIESIKAAATELKDITQEIYLITRSYTDEGEKANVLQLFLDCGWHVIRYSVAPNVFCNLLDETGGEFLLAKEPLAVSDELIYIDYNTVYKDLLSWTKEQPFNYSAIYGVPRSGSVIAGMLAHILDLPIYHTFRPKSSRRIKRQNGPILVIDDTSWTGNAMESIELDVPFEKAAVYCSEYMSKRLDRFYKILPSIKHTFPWNFLRDINVTDYTCDLDGVFCYDFEFGQDEGELYQDFLVNAKPFLIPKFTIGRIVTARLEKYRPQTEYWLEKHNIKYNELIMLPAASHEERMSINIPKFKYDNYSGLLFVESAKDQAAEIKRISNRPVFCTDIMEMLN